MIPFIDSIRKDTDGNILPIEYFDDPFWNKFITLRILASMLLGLFMFLYNLTLLPFLFFLSTLDWILEGINYVYNIRKRMVKKNKIGKALIEYGNSFKDDTYSLKGYKHDTDLDLAIFVLFFITDFRNRFETLNKFDNVICSRNRRRSVGDIYLITKHYYPNCKFEEVLQILIKYALNKDISGSYCTTIDKFVFYNRSLGSQNSFYKDNQVEYLNDTKMNEIIKYYGIK